MTIYGAYTNFPSEQKNKITETPLATQLVLYKKTDLHSNTFCTTKPDIAYTTKQPED